MPQRRQLGFAFTYFFIGAGLVLVLQGALLVGIGLALIGGVALAISAQIRSANGNEKKMWRRRKRASTDGELPVTEGKGSQHVPESDTRRLPIPRPETALGGFIELVILVVAALGMALAIQAWAVKPYQIPSHSMEPTLDVGQRILVNRFVYHFTDPAVGDIAVFHPPAGADVGGECGAVPAPEQACAQPTSARSDQNFIKRIVAGPGDTLSIHNGHPVVNGVEKTDEPYTIPCGSGGGACDLSKEIVIPAEHYFMMGDNRGASQDSRFWGPVPREWIIGRAFATYWPPDRWGFF